MRAGDHPSRHAFTAIGTTFQTHNNFSDHFLLILGNPRDLGSLYHRSPPLSTAGKNRFICRLAGVASRPLTAKRKSHPRVALRFGAGGGTRTHTMSPSTDFESVTSANSITPAYIRPFGQRLYCIIVFPKSQVLPQDFFAGGSNLSEKFTNTPCILPENTL